MKDEFSAEAHGPKLLTVEEIGDWDGREIDVVKQANEWMFNAMFERHGLIYIGGGMWTMVCQGTPSNYQEVDGKPEWDGIHPIDFDTLCDNPRAYGVKLYLSETLGAL